jgi:hypothetical protein
MDPIAVDVRLIKAMLGTELKIAPGRVLMARVVTAAPTGRGSLNIAGMTLEAKLPKDVQPGQELRLIVRDVTPDRVELSMADPSAVVAAPAAPLPGGGSVQVSERDAGGGSAAGGATDRHTLSLRYDAPALGPVDLRFELDPGSLRLTATLAAGEPADRARAAAQQLRDALSTAIGAGAPTVSVEVTSRREPLDVYA